MTGGDINVFFFKFYLILQLLQIWWFLILYFMVYYINLGSIAYFKGLLHV